MSNLDLCHAGIARGSNYTNYTINRHGGHDEEGHALFGICKKLTNGVD